MKTQIKLFTTLIVLASILLFASITSAQTVISASSYPFPTRDEIRSTTTTEQVVGGTASSETYLTSFGLNNYFTSSHLPQYMFDVYCDPTNGTLTDINISCPNCTPANAVGYRIGGNYVLWHDGDVSSIFVGVNAGNTSGLGLQNTFVGGNAGSSVTTNGNANVAVGYYSLTANTSGNHNTALGDHALYSNIASNNNTAVGGNALQNNISGSNNTAVGYDAPI